MPKQPASVVFIHGLAKKPAPDKLLELWLWGLERGNPMPDVFVPPNEGIDLTNDGVPSSLNYYADVFYGTDYETDLDSYRESGNDEARKLESEMLDGARGRTVAPVAQTAREREFLSGFEAKLEANMAVMPLAAAAESATKGVAGPAGLELAILVPPAVRRAIIKKAAMEAYYYLFDKEFERADGQKFQVRRELRDRLLAVLDKARSAADKVVVISHSMGTMVAYDVLRNCAGCPEVDTLITLGSPLGVREVQQELKASGAGKLDFPAATVNRWINVYDPLDVVCGADPRFANDFASVDGKSVEDIKESNWGSWRHSITHYLAGKKMRAALRQALEN